VSRDANCPGLQALLAPAETGEPRIAPARPRELGPLARAVAVIAARATGAGPPNVLTTLGRHPRLFRAWLRYSAHLMPFGTLPRRDTELVILRVAWRCGAAYEWHQHVPLALRVGLTADEVAGAAGEPHSFTARRQALLAAADELLADRALSDATWRAVRDTLSEREAIELCLLVGHYQGLATALGGLQIQVEESAGVSSPASSALGR
jgi:alkylhydroperoxidase family enzyme